MDSDSAIGMRPDEAVSAPDEEEEALTKSDGDLNAIQQAALVIGLEAAQQSWFHSLPARCRGGSHPPASQYRYGTHERQQSPCQGIVLRSFRGQKQVLSEKATY